MQALSFGFFSGIVLSLNQNNILTGCVISILTLYYLVDLIDNEITKHLCNESGRYDAIKVIHFRFNLNFNLAKKHIYIYEEKKQPTFFFVFITEDKQRN